MLLKDLDLAVRTAKDNITKQQAVVDALAAKVNAGVKTIEVYSDGIGWSTVETVAYWQIQYDKSLEVMKYAGALNGLQTSLQEILDSQLPTIPVPVSSSPVVVK